MRRTRRSSRQVVLDELELVMRRLEQIKNMVDMNKVEREDDMQNSRSAGENVLASAPSQHSRSAGEHVLASSPAQRDAEGVQAVFSFMKLHGSF
jgi:hypothetical protein